jgi:hypothetical protein
MGFQVPLTTLWVSRYFMHIMDIPYLAERLGCVLFMRNFDGICAQVRPRLSLLLTVKSGTSIVFSLHREVD